MKFIKVLTKYSTEAMPMACSRLDWLIKKLKEAVIL